MENHMTGLVNYEGVVFFVGKTACFQRCAYQIHIDAHQKNSISLGDCFFIQSLVSNIK